jgi:hypothetical protein
VEVSIQAVSPALIFDESTENGSVGAAGAAASDAANASGVDAALAAGADAATAAEASSAIAGAECPAPAANSDAAIKNVMIVLRIVVPLSPCRLDDSLMRFTSACVQSAAASISLMRTRNTSLIGMTKIFRFALSAGCCALHRFDSQRSDIVCDRSNDVHLQEESDNTFSIAVQLRMFPLAPNPSTSIVATPEMQIADNASRGSWRLNGLLAVPKLGTA